MGQKGIHKLVYGMYLLTTREDSQDFGCIVNTVMQVSSKPTRIAVCVVKSNLTHDALQRAGTLNLCALTEDVPYTLVHRFGMKSARKADKFSDISGFSRGSNGIFYLTHYSNMYLSAQVTEQVDLGDHTLFIAEILEDAVLSDKVSCTYDHFLQYIASKKHD